MHSSSKHHHHHKHHKHADLQTKDDEIQEPELKKRRKTSNDDLHVPDTQTASKQICDPPGANVSSPNEDTACITVSSKKRRTSSPLLGHSQTSPTHVQAPGEGVSGATQHAAASLDVFAPPTKKQATMKSYFPPQSGLKQSQISPSKTAPSALLSTQPQLPSYPISVDISQTATALETARDTPTHKSPHCIRVYITTNNLSSTHSLRK